jgi:hypothetical protein
MPTTPLEDGLVDGVCCRCARPTYGRRVRYGVGWRRGDEPRTLDTDLRVLAVDEVVVCETCEQRLVRAGIAGKLEQILLPATAALLVSASIRDFATGVIVLAGFAIWVLVRWHARRSIVLREMLFAARRDEYARRLGRPAGSLAAYPAPIA